MPVVRPLKGPTEAPSSFKQPSRKGKKAWRKNVDVTEVEQGLAELNEAIIQGGVVAERPSEELFTIDTVGDTTVSKKFPKFLKSDEIIAARSAVPAVDSRKRATERTLDEVLPAKRQRTGCVTTKELARLRRVADGHHESTLEFTDDAHDPWSAEAALKTVKDPVLDSRFDKKKAPRSFHQKPISLAANGKAVAAIAKPSGGYSYNPAYNDYEARLTEESNKAVEKEEKRLVAEEADRLKKEGVTRSAAEAEAAEARAELSEWEEDSEWEGFQSGGEELKGAVKRSERKTPAQRNRIKRRKEEERRLKHESKMGVKTDQAEQIKKIAQIVTERHAASALVRAEESDSNTEGNDIELRRKQLGRLKLPEKDLELVLPDELQDSLRLLKPEGDLLKDRYRSLLVRGRMESRRRIPFKKRAKAKLTEKWTYKDFSI